MTPDPNKCNATFVGAPHTAWIAQGFTQQVHTCDLPKHGNGGPHTCKDEPGNDISGVPRGKPLP